MSLEAAVALERIAFGRNKVCGMKEGGCACMGCDDNALDEIVSPVYSYKVICDETNNSPTDVEQSKLNVMFEMKRVDWVADQLEKKIALAQTNAMLNEELK